MNKKKKTPFPDSNGKDVSDISSKKNKISDLIHLLWPFIVVLLLMALGAILFYKT